MSRIIWGVVGAAVGFIAAHQFSKTETGQKFFEEYDRKFTEVSDAVVEGYKAREGDIKSALENVEKAIKDFTN